jgi:hypothetical protein
VSGRILVVQTRGDYVSVKFACCGSRTRASETLPPTQPPQFPSLAGGSGGPQGGYGSGGGWGGRPYPPPPPPPSGRKGGGAGGGSGPSGGGVPMHYQQLGHVRPPPMAMGVYPQGMMGVYPQGMMAQGMMAPIAGYMAASPMGGAYPVAYAPYPGGVPPPMQAAYAAGPMAYGMQPMAAMQQHAGQWAAPPMAGRPPPPPPHHPPAGGEGRGGGGGGGGNSS